MRKLKFAILGCGYWSQFQLGAWQELPGVECVALYNRTLSKANDLAGRFGVPNTYDDPVAMLKNEELDFIDIITDVDTHKDFTLLGIDHGLDVICQKPMAPDLPAARLMLEAASQANVQFYVHENYRWQPQFRRIKKLLDQGVIGRPFRCRSGFNTAFPVFDTQPFLKELTHFALTDQGSHQFDVLRFLFGEVHSLYCLMQRVNPGIKGEDVATTLFRMANGVTCIQEISFSSRLEREIFPQTLMLIEGEKGSIRLDPDFRISVTTSEGTSTEKVAMKKYVWQTERLEPEPPSIVALNENILDDMRGEGVAENTGKDNFETVRLVWAAYESARQNRAIEMESFH